MANLTQTSIISRKIFKVILILLTISLAVLIFMVFGKSIRDQIFPPEPAPATVAFGKLPQMDLSGGYKPSPGITYSLETVTGDLPNLGPLAKVFAVEPPKVQFGDVEKARRSATRVGFTNPPELIAPSKLKFVDPNNSERTLIIETSTGNLVVDSSWQRDLKILTERIRNEEDAKKEARTFMQAFEITREEFPDEKLKLIKYRVDAGKLVEVPAASQANLIRVIFKRLDLDKLPIFPQRENEDPIWALMSNEDLVAANVTNSRVQRFKFATYPLKGTPRAFEDLKGQKAAFVNQDYVKNSQNRLVIKEIFLGYIESKNTVSYLQPVYIFKGLDFVAYVPAVDDAWIAGKGI